MTTTKQPHSRKARKKQTTKIIIEHEFVGNQTIIEALAPVIIEDLKQKMEDNRTFDCTSDSA